MSNEPPGSPEKEDRLGSLANLYDRFHNSFDPLSEDAEIAERLFGQEVAAWHDACQDPRPDFQSFRKAIILKCRRYLVAERKPPTV